MIKYSYLVVVTIVLYAAFAAFNYLYLSKIISFASTLYIMVGVILAAPVVIIRMIETRKVKEYETNFPIFLQDFIEAIRGGMALPQAFKAVSDNSYGLLTPLVKRMTIQLDWGIPVETVLTKFAQETKSRIIARVVSTVMESHKFGGRLTDTFEALSNTTLEIERLRSERRLFLNSQIMTGYIIFFVFLFVIIGLQKYLVPSLGQVSSTGLAQTSGAQQSDLPTQYTEIFRNLILIQGLFAGITVGKMSEGSMVAGIKHSVVMMIVGITVFLIMG
ncbi:MAG: type II secretion system F family protein [Candidatus Aenigmarchaeota archaeon]|nr:type II secretion system F family protein [Candidatus Aenigmarchaeota archaeon]